MATSRRLFVNLAVADLEHEQPGAAIMTGTIREAARWTPP